MERLIKKVSERSWQEFKAESARHGMRMGEFLGHLLEEHKEKKKDAWNMILSRKRKRALTDKEAEEMKKALAVFERIDYE